VLPVVTAFLSAHKRVAARLLLVDRVVDLVEEGLDVGVRIGNLPDSTLRATGLGTIRYIACASPAYLAQRGKPTAPVELAGHDCISFNTISHPERWTFGGDKERRVTVSPRLNVNTAEAAIDAAKEGLGITPYCPIRPRQALPTALSAASSLTSSPSRSRSTSSIARIGSPRPRSRASSLLRLRDSARR
jgi:DNA-binding transcriptional LysR family regulator